MQCLHRVTPKLQLIQELSRHNRNLQIYLMESALLNGHIQSLNQTLNLVNPNLKSQEICNSLERRNYLRKIRN